MGLGYLTEQEALRRIGADVKFTAQSIDLVTSTQILFEAIAAGSVTAEDMAPDDITSDVYAPISDLTITAGPSGNVFLSVDIEVTPSLIYGDGEFDYFVQFGRSGGDLGIEIVCESRAIVAAGIAYPCRIVGTTSFTGLTPGASETFSLFARRGGDPTGTCVGFVRAQTDGTGGGGSGTPIPDSRAINTTAPLTGGGDLTADRTLAISAATTIAAGSMSAADKTKLDAISGTNTGDQTNITGNAGTATKLLNARTIAMSGDVAWSVSFDGSGDATAAGTLATVNSNVGSFGSATQVATFTVNAKGLTTAAANVTITPAVGSITGLGSGVATFLATPSSANLLAAVTDETGSGALVFGTTPTLATPVINGLPTGTGVSAGFVVSTLVSRDASGNTSINNVLKGYTSTATAAGTTTMAVFSTFTQVFTGTTTQTVLLPTTSVAQGHQHLIHNKSTGAVTVQSSGANTIVILAAGTSALFTANTVSPTTAAHWDFLYAADIVASGKSLTLSNTLTFTGTDGSSVAFGAGGTVLFNGGALGTPSSGTLTNCTFPTLNQNTTGSAGTLSPGRNIDGQAFTGAADITVIAPGTHAATSKATPVDADELPMVDSAASNVLKKLTWANLKATLKTYLDTLYQPLASALTTLAGLTATTDNFIVSVAGAWASRTPAQVRSTLGLVIGTNVQAWDADNDAVANSGIAAAWTAFTPTVTSSVGTITTYTASGHYMIVGKTMFIEITITITTAGTGAGTLNVTNMPGSSPRRQFLGGVEDAVANKMAVGRTTGGATTLAILDYTGVTLIANSARFQMTGVLEIS